jgi:hypothetical protein
VDSRQHWIALAVLLATVTSLLIWFDYAAATAIFHPQPDPGGKTLFQIPGYSNTVYPFTYVGVAASVFGVAWFVYKRERPELRIVPAALLALIIGNLASIGMINTFEQAFVGLRYFTIAGQGDSVYWLGLYWGDPRSAGLTLAGMLPVLAILPWARRRNLPSVLLCLGLYALAMSVWFYHGYGDPQYGDATDYGLNSLARIASQLALVAAVSSQDLVRVLWRRCQSLRRRPAPGGSSAVPENAP